MAWVYWIHTDNMTDIKTQGYLGVSTKVKERFWDHKKQARNGTHPNPHLANAINKYANGIQHTIIFEGPIEGCYQIEEYFRPNEKIGWNLAKGGFNSSRMEGKKHSEEAKKKMSQSGKGRKKSEAHKQAISQANKGRLGKKGAANPRARKVLCIETNTEYATVKDAAMAVNCSDTNLIAYLSGRTKSAGGHTWKYLT